MSDNLQAAQLRRDIITMKDIIQRIGGYPDSKNRKKIVELINRICVHQVTDRSTPEDIDNGQFRYGIQPNDVKEEVLVKFMY